MTARSETLSDTPVDVAKVGYDGLTRRSCTSQAMTAASVRMHMRARMRATRRDSLKRNGIGVALLQQGVVGQQDGPAASTRCRRVACGPAAVATLAPYSRSSASPPFSGFALSSDGKLSTPVLRRADVRTVRCS